MNNTDRFLTGKKNEAPLSKTGLYESSDARCPSERARARTSWAKFMLPFSFASHYQRRVLRWKALISSARRGRRHKVHTRAQNMVAVIIMAQMGSLPCLILYFELHGGRKYAEHLTSAYKTATLSPQMSRTVKKWGTRLEVLYLDWWTCVL